MNYKSINKLLVFLLIFFAFSNIEISAQEKNEGREYLKIEVNGLSCPFCAYGLEKKLRNGIKDLQDLQIDFKKGFVSFSFVKGNKPEEETLQKIVSDAGFEINKIVYGEKPFSKEQRQ